jgi:hypothetical protein
MPNRENAMTDSYRVTEISEAAQGKRSGSGTGGAVRPLLWLLLVISGAGNVITSSTTTVSVFVGIGFGLVALSCGVVLAVDHYRRRRR